VNTLLGSLASNLAYFLLFFLYLAGIAFLFGLVDRFLLRKDDI